ncbi:MAG: YihY/virulence factor BrkB family protein [Blastocatellia bacterium]|jgi:membrane protein
MQTTPIKAPPTSRMDDPALAAPAVGRGPLFYIRGSWAFFGRMWPAIYDLTTTETYVNASAIAFNILLSFFSFIVLVGSFLINILHWRGGYETFYLILRSLVPKDSGQIFWSLDRVTQGPGGKATVVSFALLIFSSLGIFQPIEMVLNRAWGFKERSVLRQYLVYVGLTLGCALLMFCLISIGSFYNWMLEIFAGSVETRAWVFRYIGPVISLPFIFILLFGIYYFVPNGKVDGGQLFFTSVAMAILWVIMTFLFRLALPIFGFEESYNRLASLMALGTWILISSFVLILGANLATHQVLPRAWTGPLPLLSRLKAGRGDSASE